MRNLFCLSLFLGSFLFFTHGQSKHALEEVINHYIYAYPLSLSNQFRLATYAELKAKISYDERSILIPFGDLGTLTMYSGNCLLRTPDYQVFHLSLSDTSSSLAQAFNQKLNHIFESILLMSDDDADPDVMAFVDKHLARKNIEPFEKIYLRHILLRYGRYHPEKKYIELHSDWLPGNSYEYRKPGDLHMVRRQASPLRIRLDEQILRGYYIKAGGTVFVEDLKGVRHFATGETYDYNVAAFKLFLQKLFVQSVQYIMKNESQRTYQQALLAQTVVKDPNEESEIQLVATTADRPPQIVSTPASSYQKSSVKSQIQPLYSPHDWMPMMLGILRANHINIGDPDIIRYFVGEAYFPKLYRLLLPEEKEKVDLFQGKSVPRSISPSQLR